MVEFALVLPIFLLILSGILDFGFLLFDRMSVINAAREGARTAVMINDPADIVHTATDSAISAGAQGGIDLTGQVHVTCLATHVSPTSTAEIGCETAVSGDSVKVKIGHSYTMKTPLLPGMPINLDATVQMVIEY